jgi:hypothetical protein
MDFQPIGMQFATPISANIKGTTHRKKNLKNSEKFQSKLSNLAKTKKYAICYTNFRKYKALV